MDREVGTDQSEYHESESSFMSVSLGDTFFKGDEFKDSMGDYSDLISICPSPAQTVSQSTSHAVRQSSDLCTPQSRGGFDRDVDRALSPQNPNPNPNALQMLQELYAKSRCVCHPPPACLTVRQSDSQSEHGLIINIH